MSKFQAVFEDVRLKLTPAISGFVNSAALESEVRGTRLGSTHSLGPRRVYAPPPKKISVAR